MGIMQTTLPRTAGMHVGIIRAGLSFGHFNENSRAKNSKLKSKKPETQGFSQNTKIL